MDASSSAVSACDGDQPVEERDDRGYVDLPMWDISSSCSGDMPPSELSVTISGCCKVAARGRSPGPRIGGFDARPDPPNFFCSHPKRGLLL